MVSHRKGLLTSYWTHTRSRESSGRAKSDAVSKPRAAWQPQTRLHKNIVPCRHCMHRRQAGKPLGHHACDCRCACDPARALCPPDTSNPQPFGGRPARLQARAIYIVYVLVQTHVPYCRQEITLCSRFAQTYTVQLLLVRSSTHRGQRVQRGH